MFGQGPGSRLQSLPGPAVLMGKLYQEIPLRRKRCRRSHRENEGCFSPRRSGKIGPVTETLDDVAREFVKAREDSARYKVLLAEAQAKVAELQPLLAPAIVEAAREGRTVTEIRTLTGYSRKRIYQICRAQKVEPAP